MKLFKINYIFLFYIMGMLVFTTSCETSEETFSQFTEGGEIILLGKPLSVTINPGNLRAQFNVRLNADPKIKTGKIEWTKKDGTKASRDFDVVRAGNGFENIALLITDIEEGVRSYTITMFGDNGLTSLPEQTLAVTVYGAFYQSTILPRLVNEVSTFNDGTAKIQLSDNIIEGMSYTKISYEDVSGTAQEIQVENDVLEIDIPSYNGGSEIKVFSVYLPAANVIDTFESKMDIYTFP